jgi:hypothetical protein
MDCNEWCETGNLMQPETQTTHWCCNLQLNWSIHWPSGTHGHGPVVPLSCRVNQSNWSSQSAVRDCDSADRDSDSESRARANPASVP